MHQSRIADSRQRRDCKGRRVLPAKYAIAYFRLISHSRHAMARRYIVDNHLFVLPFQGANNRNAVFTQGVARTMRLPWARLCCTFSVKNKIAHYGFA